MQRYYFQSAALHFALIGLFALISFLSPSRPIWFDGTGFDVYGPGGPGGGDRKPKGGQLKKAKRGQVVPQPQNVPIPDKPAPVQKATKSAEKWKVEDVKPKKVIKKALPVAQPIQRGEKDQGEKTNIIRRGVKDGSTAGQDDFDFQGSGSGTGKGLGIGFGPGGGGGGAGMGGYLAVMRRKIWNEWVQYATFGNDKSCVVSMVITKSGQVHSVRLEKSSGDSLFDTQARKAVRNSQPLPPLPPNFPRRELSLRMKFVLLD